MYTHVYIYKIINLRSTDPAADLPKVGCDDFSFILEALAYLGRSGSQESQSWLFGTAVQAGAPMYGDLTDSGGRGDLGV